MGLSYDEISYQIENLIADKATELFGDETGIDPGDINAAIVDGCAIAIRKAVVMTLSAGFADPALRLLSHANQVIGGSHDDILWDNEKEEQKDVRH